MSFKKVIIILFGMASLGVFLAAMVIGFVVFKLVEYRTEPLVSSTSEKTDFYNNSGGWDYQRLPLIYPYHAIKVNDLWIVSSVESESSYNSIVSEVKEIQISSPIIVIYSENTSDNSGVKREKIWTIINVEKKDTQEFFIENDFNNYLTKTYAVVPDLESIDTKYQVFVESGESFATTNFSIYILATSSEGSEKPEELLEKTKKQSLDTDSKVVFTEKDVKEFDYGLIYLTQSGKDKLSKVCPDKGQVCLYEKIFVVKMNNENLIIGSSYDDRFPRLPKHPYINFPPNETGELDSIYIRLYPFDRIVTDKEIKVLQNYFYSIGKAREPWQENPTPY